MSYESTVLADSPAGYWRLNEASGTVAADSSGHGLAGTIGISVVGNQPSPLAGDPAAKSMQFNSTSTSIVQVPDNALLNPTGDITVELWYKLNSANNPSVLNKGDGASVAGSQYDLYFDAPGLTWGVYEGGHADGLFLGGQAINVWHHLVGTRSAAGALLLFLDGAQVASGSGSGAPLNTGAGNPNPLTIGNNRALNRGYDGWMAEVAIYPAVLSPTRVLAHYNAGTQTTTPPDAPGGVSAIPLALVSWSPPASDGGSAVTGYTVTSSPGGIVVHAGPSQASAVVTGLQPGTEYTFTVTATNALGTGPASTPSNSVGATGDPESVQGDLGALTGVAGESSEQIYAKWLGLVIPSDGASLEQLVRWHLDHSGGITAAGAESLLGMLLAGGAQGESVEDCLRKTGLVGFA